MPVVPWSAGWAAAFAAEARVLEEHLAPWLVGGVEHIGSTAVAGLAAKPVLDALAPVRDLEEARAAVPVLERLGYVHEDHRPHEALWFRKDTGGERSHQLHLTAPGSALWRERLAFRDALRGDPALRSEYADLKQERAGDDLAAYTAAKRPLVERVLAAAGLHLQPRLEVGGGDADLDARLSAELDAFNVAASGVDDQRELTVRITDADGLAAGLSGWTWGTCAGIAMVWVREDRRGDGLGAQLLAAAEGVARQRGCSQVVVSSFTFQAPGFYARQGYVETGRTEELPVAGAADVHFRKDLV